MKRLTAVVGLLSLCAVCAAQTSVPTLMNYQGRLTATSGAPLPDGQYKLTFRLFGQLSGGTQTWFQEMSPVVVRNGVFAVLLGSGTPLTEAMFTGTTFLEVQVGDAAPLTPRQPIVSVAYAMKAERAKVADTVPTGSIGTAVIADGAVTTPKLADGSVDGSKVAPGAITSTKVAGGAVTEPHLADSIIGRRAIANDPTALEKMTAGALDIQNSGDVRLATNHFIGLFPSSERFVYDSKQAPQYGLGWYTDSWYGNAPTAWITGYGGIKFFTLMQPRLTIDAWGNVDIPGNLRVRGTSKNRVVPTLDYGERLMYAFESTENRFLDQGVAALVNGTATISLDPVFCQTIEGDLLVHVTPYGHASMYVERLTPTSFTVRLLQGEPAARFAWQVSAASKGQRGVRMAPVPKVGDR